METDRLRVLVADDEGPARRLLADLVRAQDDAQVAGEVTNGVDLLRALADGTIDVVMLDDDLPGLIVSRPGAAPPVWVLVAAEEPQPGSMAGRLGSWPPLVLLKPPAASDLAFVLAAARSRLRARASDPDVTTHQDAVTHPQPAGVNPSSHSGSTSPTRPAGTFRRERRSPSKAWLLLALAFCAGYLLMGAPPSSEPGSLAVPTDEAYRSAIEGYRPISFVQLSGFDYRDGMPLSALPAEVRQAHRQKVAIHGFMMPLDASGSGVSQFLLNGNYDMCMFGAGTGSPNQWVEVVMPRGRPAEYTHQPITVIGALTIGARRKNGRVYSLYHVEADRVVTTAAPL